MLDPVAISLGPLQIHWYGLTYVLGFGFAYWFVLTFSKDFGITKERAEDIFFYTMLFSIVGGRLGFVLFYDFLFYLTNPLQILAVWNGGMSAHGGIAGAILTQWYFARKDKISLYKIMDMFAIPALFAFAFGRLANFINQELVGKPTSSFIGLVFPLYDDVSRYPYQLIASAKNMLAMQIILYLHFFKSLKPGMLAALSLLLYSLGRFFVDFIREPTISLGIVSMGQLLSLIGFVISLAMIYYINQKHHA